MLQLPDPVLGDCILQDIEANTKVQIVEGESAHVIASPWWNVSKHRLAKVSHRVKQQETITACDILRGDVPE